VQQIEEKNYKVELKAAGVKNIIKLKIVFVGKNILIKEAEKDI
jgi:hypothetical protein